MTRVEKGVLHSVLTLLFAAATFGAQSDPGSPPQHQTKPQGSATAQSGVAEQSATSTKPGRIELAPVSTSEETRHAAREISKRQAGSPAKSADAKPKGDDLLLGTPDRSAVDEFKPGSPANSTDEAVVVKQSKKSAGKNIHGTAYGGLDPTASANHQTGGSVGATSKTGKTSVYVETDSSRATPSSH